MKQFEEKDRQRVVPYIAAFFLPFLICVVICIGNGVYPFGDNCILHMDMYHQYCPFFTEFLEKMQNGGSMQYSWNLGLGSDFVSLYAYYLASPLNLLLLLCSKGHVIELMTFLILGKIAASGLTFFIFLKNHYHMVGKDGRLHANLVVPALVFSTAYALSGFTAAYSWDIMWMDCIALFPLIMVGLEQLVQEKRPQLYYVTLALSIFSNYYISIMICMFLVFFFAYLFVRGKGRRLGAFLRFSWYSLLAGASSAILLLPEIAVLAKSGSAGDGFPETMKWYFNILAEFGRAATTAGAYTGNDHWPNLYAGAFSLVLVWLYLLNRRISWKEKVPGVMMLGVFIVSFANNQLDYIWHGMHFPQGLPGRESFLYIFIILWMGFAAVRKWKGIRQWHILLATVMALVALLAGGMTGAEDVTEPVSLIITALFVCVYGIMMLLMKLSRERQFHRMLVKFAFCTAVGELAINMAVTGLGVTSRIAYMNKQEAYQELLEMAEQDNEQTENTFYRVEDTGRKTKNDDALYGYPSATIFSSLMNLDVSHLFQCMYMEGGKNFYCYNGATPLPSAMLSVRYMLSANPQEESRVRTLVGTSGGNYLYRNNYWLPLGIVMDEEAIDAWETSTTGRMSSLNSLASALGAEGEMFYPATCAVWEEEGDTTIDITEDGYYYADYVECNSDSLTVSRSDGWTKQYSKTTHRYLIELGECKSGTEIHITNLNAENISFRIYRLNFEALDQAYETLGQQTMELIDMTDRQIDGKISISKAGRLILSVPADEGWELYVDGDKTQIQPFQDAFIGMYLEEGEHEIRLRYTTPGLKMGAAVSAGAVALFLLCMLFRKFIWKISDTRGNYGKKED